MIDKNIKITRYDYGCIDGTTKTLIEIYDYSVTRNGA
jgi:hypothetical protein